MEKFQELTGVKWKNRGEEGKGEFKWVMVDEVKQDHYVFKAKTMGGGRQEYEPEVNAEYEKLFSKVWAEDFDALEEMTIKRPIGKQLHVTVKDHGINLLQIAIHKKNIKLAKKILEIAFKQYTPLPFEEEDSAGKRQALDNESIANMMSKIRPGDYLDASGMKKIKKKNNNPSNMQVNCIVNPKVFLDADLVEKAMRDPKDTELLNVILEAGSEKWVGQFLHKDAMSIATKHKHLEAIKTLIKYSEKVPIPKKVELYKGLDVAGKKSDWADEHKGKSKTSQEESPALSAQQCNNFEMSKWFIENYTIKGTKDVESGYIYHFEWKHIAERLFEQDPTTMRSTPGAIDHLQYLISVDKKLSKNGKGEYFDKKPKNGDSMLIKAIEQNDIALFQLLLKAGASLDTTSNNEECEHPVLYAAKYSQHRMLAEVLKASSDEQVQKKDARKGDTLLTYLAGTEEVLKLKAVLADGRIDVNETDAQGFNALQIAAQNKNHKNYALLLAKTNKKTLASESPVGMIPFDFSVDSSIADLRERTEPQSKEEENEEEEEEAVEMEEDDSDNEYDKTDQQLQRELFQEKEEKKRKRQEAEDNKLMKEIQKVTTKSGLHTAPEPKRRKLASSEEVIQMFEAFQKEREIAKQQSKKKQEEEPKDESMSDEE